jgi:tetratricopeptide (TPR) repeat protein
LAAGVAAIAWFIAAPVLAAPSDADEELARGHFELGLRYYGQARFGEAAAEFEKSLELSGKRELLYNLARAYQHAGDLARALESYRGYLDQLGPASSDRAEIARICEDLDHRVGHLVVHGSPPGAKVSVDSRRVGTLPLDHKVLVNPGPHELRVAMERYATFRKELSVRAGTEQGLAVDLVPLEVARGFRPLVRQWWLWTTVGAVVVAGLATAIWAGTREVLPAGGTLTLPQPMP